MIVREKTKSGRTRAVTPASGEKTSADASGATMTVSGAPSSTGMDPSGASGDTEMSSRNKPQPVGKSVRIQSKRRFKTRLPTRAQIPPVRGLTGAFLLSSTAQPLSRLST